MFKVIRGFIKNLYKNFLSLYLLNLRISYTRLQYEILYETIGRSFLFNEMVIFLFIISLCIRLKFLCCINDDYLAIFCYNRGIVSVVSPRKDYATVRISDARVTADLLVRTWTLILIAWEKVIRRGFREP